MKKLSFFLLATCLLTFTSCIDIIEEMFLNKDGSGKYTLKIDMSELMAEDGGMKDMLDSFGAQDEEGGEKVDMPSEVDSIMHLKYAPDSIKSRIDNPAFLDKVKIRTLISESKEKMLFEFILDFDDVSDIDYFLANLDKLQASNVPGNEGPLGQAGNGFLPGSKEGYNLFTWTKKSLTRSPALEAQEKIPEDELGMMKMFFSGGTYKTIYHFPGKVKNTTIEGAQIDGKTVTAEFPFTDILEGKQDFRGMVKFKKK